jgi:glycosyltransferase involved in cell wall biosynthesis
MKVVHVHRIGGIGGSERHLLTLLPALAESGLDVRFVGLDNPAAAPDPFYEQLRVPYERLSCRWDFDSRLVRRLRRALRDADLVHTHLVHADVHGALAARAPLVSTKHNDDRFRLGPYRHVERLLTRRFRRVIAISEALREFTVERVGLPGEKVEVVRYGLDELPAPWGENPDLDLPDEARVLLCVARLAPQKGVDVAVRALPAIRAEHPGAALVVLGEGPERPRLAAEGVYLPGRVGDVAAWYRRAELVVHPARWEGFGIALLEAMLAGKPVVASAVSSAPEIVADGSTGLLVPPEDPVALAAAVNRLLGDPARLAAFGRSGLERARAEFSVERMATATAAVYESAFGNYT